MRCASLELTVATGRIGSLAETTLHSGIRMATTSWSAHSHRSGYRRVSSENVPGRFPIALPETRRSRMPGVGRDPSLDAIASKSMGSFCSWEGKPR